MAMLTAVSNSSSRVTSSSSSASMAMSGTDSSFAQWAGLYHHDPSPGLPTDGAAADSDMFAAAAATSPTSGRSGGSPTKAQQLHGIEGPRVRKPARRRSRASRRAPVTLLNTDTVNFRAMVQQFTGIPAPPAGTFGGPAGVPVINFAGDYVFPPSSAVMSFDHHLHRSHPPPAPLQDQLRSQQQYTGATFGYNSQLVQAGPGAGGGDMFGCGLTPAEDRMLLQSIQAAQMPHMPPASNANTSANGFFA